MENGKRKKEKNFTSFKNIVSFVFLIFIILSCGHRQDPTGGKKDTIKPEIVNIFPAEFSEINTQNIEIIFSKPIDRTTILTGIYVYPPIDKKKFKWDKNTLIIKINEELEINTNYFFTFSRQIKGEHKNELDQDYTFVFRSGNLNENRISGNILFELDEDKNQPVKVELMTADSINIVTREFFAPTYEFENLNNIEHQITAFVDKNKNDKYDPEKEPFFQAFIPYHQFSNLDIELIYVDTLNPEIRSARVVSNNQVELSFSEIVKGFSDINIISDDSLQTELHIIADFLDNETLYLVTENLDSLAYEVSISNLEDRKKNILPETSILFDGIVIPDTIAPKIIYTKPGNGTTIDNLLPEIEIMFSEIILAENFNATLTNVEKHKEIPLKIIQGDSKRFMVNPLKNLQNYSSYNFNLTISDASGNYLQKENLFTFIPIIR